ncbi:hypothetical protein GOBAR_AA28521 [Gossypium barbadense]|uniref:Uncharacterized protein n=1 Tax=Gossypium barbadense TaxID=3634 RepID=A0A2P5WM24_GOSBA|nr:hypothetical protein GOBAR_AA28521 [Gossypium barbadense]
MEGTRPRATPVCCEGSPCLLNFFKCGRARLLSHALGVCGTWPCRTAVPRVVLFSRARVVWCHTHVLLYRLNGTGMSYSRVKETESSLVPGTPMVFYPTPVFFLSSSPTAMSHGRGDLSHLTFWGNHVLLQHGRLARPYLFPYLATALGMPVFLAVRILGRIAFITIANIMNAIAVTAVTVHSMLATIASTTPSGVAHPARKSFMNVKIVGMVVYV